MSWRKNNFFITKIKNGNNILFEIEFNSNKLFDWALTDCNHQLSTVERNGLGGQKKYVIRVQNITNSYNLEL